MVDYELSPYDHTPYNDGVVGVVGIIEWIESPQSVECIDAFIDRVVRETYQRNDDPADNPFADVMFAPVESNEKRFLQSRSIQQTPAESELIDDRETEADFTTIGDCLGDTLPASSEETAATDIDAYGLDQTNDVAPDSASRELSNVDPDDNNTAQNELDAIYEQWCSLPLEDVQRIFLMKMSERFENVTSYDLDELSRMMALPIGLSKVMEAMHLQLTGSEPVKQVAPLYFDFTRYLKKTRLSTNIDASH